ncbi:cell division protein FtsL [uncultured Marivirga sp.]|uniref:cell division protein FtsL n=1 Tax=uncultured Marivirga sp. TaxID=1123707 RepID=UPI0030ECC938|tara:strand:+ start:267674 stop:267919 length:246 start_codon:yes stop_codon:yes gene_type:complete
MKKNLIIFILTIITAVSVVFAFNQKQQVEEQKALVKEYTDSLKQKGREQEISRDLVEKYSRIAKVEAEKLRKKVEMDQNEN